MVKKITSKSESDILERKAEKRSESSSLGMDKCGKRLEVAELIIIRRDKELGPTHAEHAHDLAQ